MFKFFLIVMSFSLLLAEEIKVLPGTAGKKIAQQIAELLEVKTVPCEISFFKDGEFKIEIQEKVRGQKIFIVQPLASSPGRSVNDNLMELYFLIRALKRERAECINAVVPYLGYARQDRKCSYCEPLSAADVAFLLETAGADEVTVVDVHSLQIEGFFQNCPLNNLSAMAIFANYMKEKKLRNPVIVSPDAGGVSRVKKFKEKIAVYGIESKMAVILKERIKANSVENMNLVGDVFGSDVVIVDDICDTGGTLVKAAAELKKKGALRVFACITHPVFSSPALERIKASAIEELIVMETMPVKENLPKNVRVLSIAPVLVKALKSK